MKETHGWIAIKFICELTPCTIFSQYFVSVIIIIIIIIIIL